jgi:hypothetical protein
MSTTNPDERENRIGTMLRPVAFGALIAVQFLAPVLWLLDGLGIIEADPGFIILYVLPWVLFGLGAMFVPSSRSPYLLAAAVLSYVAGLFVVIEISDPRQGLGPVAILFIGAPYAVALIVMVLYFLREAAIRRTREIGVDTMATVMSAPVSGMVNYVTRQRLTLKFTDQQGVQRFLRVGKTGGGWSAGDQVPIRYDPTRPGYRRGIIVDGSGPTLFS